MLKETKNTGITLIALVITIIVLLILAGISIGMLSGDNSILKQASGARDKTGVKSLKEETQIALMGRKINGYAGENNKTLKQELENVISGSEVEEINGISDACYVKKGNEYITVYENGEIEEGKVEIWDGETITCPEMKKESNIWNWYIYTPSQLKFLADFVNNRDGNSLPEGLNSYVTNAGYNIENVTMTTDTTIYLMNNLDLGARQKDGTKTAGTDWMPIGLDSNNVKNKLGTFEGNNHYIKGVYINREEDYNGIFGNSNSIYNLTIKESYIKGKSCVGGITGVFLEGKIYNCKNENTTIEAQKFTGGIAGVSRANVEKCINNGKVTALTISTSPYASSGGIVGDADNEIKDCINYGSISANMNAVGGIVGRARENSTIIRCTNDGKVQGEKYISGIVGYYLGNDVKNCINNGNISGNENSIGGIVGYDGGANNLKIIKDCMNTGSITGNYCVVGGIVGRTNKKIIKCINKGNVKKNFYKKNSNTEYTQDIGGIVGQYRGIEIDECINDGNIDASNGAVTGGIIGGCYHSEEILIRKCANLGEVKAENTEYNNGMIGGIAGYIYGSTNWSVVNTYNTGIVSGNAGVGGLLGRTAQTSGTIKNCYNTGIIKSNMNPLGSLIGDNENSSTAINSYYLQGISSKVFTYTDGEEKNSEYMKSETFLNMLNKENNPLVWEFRTGENNGYPVLIKTEE